ncbi:carbohydrate ABC transporter permease [Phytoactinopolyspora endophytica]|uniref:carbohydrate ABC transporter permease n=1 Tax=Phytoactinopolyspora endophytica TaxID=1642495 RepID=UPI00197B84F1|nr:carbohydrate ABC transporter permease [Phytoactinopolyspora endophytica]
MSGSEQAAPRRKKRSWRRLRQLPTHAVMLPLAILWVYPFIWMVSTAFKAESPFADALRLIPEVFTLDNFQRAWDVGNFGQYFFNTVVVTAGVVAIVIIVSSLAGYGLGRGDMPGRKLIVGALVATMFLPSGYSIIPVFLLIDSLGLNNSLAGVILAMAGPAHVVAILLFMGYFAALPKELEEAATIDGAGHPRIYARIMLPLAKPVVGTVAIFNIIGAWNAFLVPLVFTLTRPDLRTIGVGMYSFFGEFGTDWSALAAAAVIAIAPIVVVFLWLQKFFIEGIAGAVKN